jgi:hypothetical protein
VAVGVTRSQRKSKSEALQRLSLSAAKQRIVDSDDSMEESRDDIAGNTSQSDEDNDSGTEMPASIPSTSSDAGQPMDRTSPSPTAATERSILPTASKKTTQKKTVGKGKNEASMPVRPRTRRQASMTASQSSTVSTATEDEADSATTEAASSQTLFAIESNDSDSDFERLPVKIEKKIDKKVEKKVAPPAVKRQTTRARSAWK